MIGHTLKRITGAALAAALLAAAPLTVSAAAVSYQDVSSDSPYREAVEYVSERKLMQGTSATVFSPDKTLTRAMFVTILAREAGVRTDFYMDSSFADVKSGSWCSGAIQWAMQYEIVKGYTTTAFGVNRSVTREQMASMIARTLKNFRISLPAVEGKAFADANTASAYAKDSLEAMRQTGLMQGDKNGNFNPRGPVTRGQAAQTFMRLDKAIAAVAQTADKSAKVLSAAGASCTVKERVLVRDLRNDIRYPELSGLASANAQETWNKAFLNYAREAKAQIAEGIIYQGAFAVTENDESLLSITETGYAYVDGGMHGTANLATWTIDPATGKQIRLSDRCDTAAIAQALVSGKGFDIYTAWGKEAKPEEMSIDDVLMMNGCEKNTADVKKLLDSFDTQDPDNFGGYSYWVDGKPCMVFAAAHAAGDYCVLKMNSTYSKIA